VIVVLYAIMPGMFVIIPMVIAVIETFARCNDAGRCEHDQSQQEAALDNGFYVFHRSSKVDDAPIIADKHRGETSPYFDSLCGSWSYKTRRNEPLDIRGYLAKEPCASNEHRHQESADGCSMQRYSDGHLSAQWLTSD